MDKTKKILITGGAGFIGYHLAKTLALQNHEVTIIDDFSRGMRDKDFKERLQNLLHEQTKPSRCSSMEKESAKVETEAKAEPGNDDDAIND